VGKGFGLLRSFSSSATEYKGKKKYRGGMPKISGLGKNYIETAPRAIGE